MNQPESPRGLTRLTVNLTPRASAALDQAAGITGDSKTDTVNRALQVYALVVDETQKGAQLCFAGADGTLTRIKLA